MNKKQMLNEIVDLYDENERLKNELNKFIGPCEVNNKTSETSETSEIDNLNKMAKNLLFKEVISEWELDYECKIEVKEDSGEFNFLTFDQWHKQINISQVLRSSYKYLCNELTGKQIKDYFYTQFQEYFENKVNDKKMEIVRSKKDE